MHLQLLYPGQRELRPRPQVNFIRLCDDVRDSSGPDRAATLANREALAPFHGYRRNDLHFHRTVPVTSVVRK